MDRISRFSPSESSGRFGKVLVENRERKLRIRRRYSGQNSATLFSGDCVAMVGKLSAGADQLVITSPPYNVGKSYAQAQRLEAYLEG